MTQENHDFDFSTALKAIREGKPLLGQEGILTPLIKNLTEAALEGELDSHLGQEISTNRRNGKSQKTIKSLNGNFDKARIVSLSILFSSPENVFAEYTKKNSNSFIFSHFFIRHPTHNKIKIQ